MGAEGRGRGPHRRSAHHQLRWRQLRRGHRAQGDGQLARLCGRLPEQLCGGLRGSPGHGCEWRHAARRLVERRSAAQRSRIARVDRPGSSAAHAAPAGRAARGHAAGSHRFCAGGGAVADRLDLRSRLGRRHLARCVVPGRPAGRADRPADAGSGDPIGGGASFRGGGRGEPIAAPSLTIIDDNTMLLPSGAGGFGSSPFDGEGLPSRRTVVVEAGVLRSYLLNTYSARKLGLKSTHNASRGLAGTPGIGCGNLYLELGTQTPEEILAAIPAGLYVTGLMGFGVNVVTGDYSRGATGLWIENGALTHAVEEVTIAGNLAGMLKNVTAIGNDLEFRGAVASPTLRIDGMTIAGA